MCVPTVYYMYTPSNISILMSSNVNFITQLLNYIYKDMLALGCHGKVIKLTAYQNVFIPPY